MADIFADMLYDPNWVGSTELGVQWSQNLHFSVNKLFDQRLQAAHSDAALSIVSKEEKCPFKPESLLSYDSKQIETSRTICPRYIDLEPYMRER
jgi:hypothetical protein